MKHRRIGEVHFIAQNSSNISECLLKHFRIDQLASQTLFTLGALYCNKIRVVADQPLVKGDHLQVFLKPKRYPAVDIVWDDIICHEDEEFLVVNKPHGIPVHSTDDNLIENILFQLRKKLNKDLWVTHRLDTTVSGLMVLAKTKHFQSEFNRLLSDRKVSKTYAALVEKELTPGLLIHYMAPGETFPKKMSGTFQDGWLECSLEISKVEFWKQEGEKKFWELEIQLHTGRTHQIRAQLAQEKSPILGDKMYRGRNRAGFTTRHLALHASKLEWKDSLGHRQFTAPPAFKSEI